MASEERERFIYPYLRNWIEGFDHPGGWMLVCNARGEFNGEAFTATNGVALVGLEGWKNRTKEEEAIDRWGLLRLAPEQVRKEDGKTFVGFELSMMDAEATLMSGAGRPLGKPFTIKRGASTRPMPMPPTPSAYYRLSYSNGRFTAQGRLDIPAVPRGEIRTLDIPNPTEGIHLQTPESPVAKPSPSASVPAAPPVAAPVSAKPISPPAPAPAPAATPARPSPSSSAAAPVLFVP